MLSYILNKILITILSLNYLVTIIYSCLALTSQGKVQMYKKKTYVKVQTEIDLVRI